MNKNYVKLYTWKKHTRCVVIQRKSNTDDFAQFKKNMIKNKDFLTSNKLESRYINKQLKEDIWNDASVYDDFDPKFFRRDELGNMCIKGLTNHRNIRPELKPFYYHFEHRVSHCNNGKTDKKNLTILNAFSNIRKGKKELFNMEYKEIQKLCEENGRGSQSLLSELMEDVHKTCKKYNIYFYKNSEDKWSIKEYDYNDEYLCKDNNVSGDGMTFEGSSLGNSSGSKDIVGLGTAASSTFETIKKQYNNICKIFDENKEIIIFFGSVLVMIISIGSIIYSYYDEKYKYKQNLSKEIIKNKSILEEMIKKIEDYETTENEKEYKEYIEKLIKKLQKDIEELNTL